MTPQEAVNRTRSYLSSLPTWFSGSTLGNLLFALGTPLSLCENSTSLIRDSLGGGVGGFILPSSVWVAQVRDASDAYVVTLNVTGQAAQTLNLCSTQLELLLSTTPSYSIDYENNALIFRNLSQIEETVSPSGDTYVLSSTPLSNEPISIDVESDYFMLPEWCRSENIIATGASSGDITFRYSTAAQQALVARATTTITINSEESYSLDSYDIWNHIDELGLIPWLAREDGQTNAELLERIKLAYQTSNLNEANTLSIVNELSEAILTSWSGSGSLTLEADNVVILGLEETQLINEVLTSDSTHKTFYSTFSNWNSTYFLYRDKVRLDEPTLGITVEDGIVTSPTRLDGEISAIYSVTNYTITYSGTSAILTPTESTPEGPYNVVYTKDVSTEVPTPLGPVASDSASLRGIAAWGNSAEWIDDYNLTFTTTSLL